ncbi:hypothetical protein Tco_0667280, partial [Tanacetum coccineum]
DIAEVVVELSVSRCKLIRCGKAIDLPKSVYGEFTIKDALCYPNGVDLENKVYNETATGRKFYSKPHALNYLGIVDRNF